MSCSIQAKMSTRDIANPRAELLPRDASMDANRVSQATRVFSTGIAVALVDFVRVVCGCAAA